MPDFMFVYHGGKKPDTPEEGEAAMARWFAWIKDAGDKMINPGTPVGMSKTVYHDRVEDHGGSNPISGFSVVRVDTMDEALAIAKACPVLEMEGATVEVAEMMQMKMG